MASAVSQPYQPYTREQLNRMLTLIFDRSPVTKFAMAVAPKLWGYCERIAGLTDEGIRTNTNPPHNAWPRRARLADWLANHLDDLGMWANRRRAARRR